MSVSLFVCLSVCLSVNFAIIEMLTHLRSWVDPFQKQILEFTGGVVFQAVGKGYAVTILRLILKVLITKMY